MPDPKILWFISNPGGGYWSQVTDLYSQKISMPRVKKLAITHFGLQKKVNFDIVAVRPINELWASDYDFNNYL